jgi:hypothetical protein
LSAANELARLGDVPRRGIAPGRFKLSPESPTRTRGRADPGLRKGGSLRGFPAQGALRDPTEPRAKPRATRIRVRVRVRAARPQPVLPRPRRHRRSPANAASSHRGSGGSESSCLATGRCPGRPTARARPCAARSGGGPSARAARGLATHWRRGTPSRGPSRPRPPRYSDVYESTPLDATAAGRHGPSLPALGGRGGEGGGAGPRPEER